MRWLIKMIEKRKKSRDIAPVDVICSQDAPLKVKLSNVMYLRTHRRAFVLGLAQFFVKSFFESFLFITIFMFIISQIRMYMILL